MIDKELIKNKMVDIEKYLKELDPILKSGTRIILKTILGCIQLKDYFS